MSDTVARTKPESSSHWYTESGRAAYEVPKADGSGMRKTTLADARKQNLLPSCTAILKLLHKEGLVTWRCEQAALAVLTSPRVQGEAEDAFVYRVLHSEKQQEMESQIARDKGTEIHDALEAYFSGAEVPSGIEPWVRPAITALIAFGERASSEVILVGEGYAGRTDLIQDCEGCWRIWDYKSSKKLPDPAKGGAYTEHKLQLSAYAKAWQIKLQRAGELKKPIIVGNVYISTAKEGEFVICEHEDWEKTYERGFKPLVEHWMWTNNYYPVQESLQPPPPARGQTLETKLLESLRDPSFLQLCRDAGWLIEREEDAAQRGIVSTKPAVPTPAAPAPEVIPVPRLNPGQQHVAPALPERDKEGRKLAWSTGVVAPSNGPAAP